MGRPKHTIVWTDGRTLGERAASTLEQAGATEVVIVGSTPESRKGWATSRRFIDDTRPGQGPLAALEAILLSNLGETYVVCPCDMPGLGVQSLRTLAAAGSNPLAIFQDPSGGPRQPLPVRVASPALPLVRSLLDQGERSLMALLDRLPSSEVTPGIECALVDIDTAADLAKLES